MTDFHIDKDLEIGSVFEVAGSEIKIALSKSITELTRSHSGRVYNVGQIGSLLKMHLGRKILFATVKLLRLQSDEEIAAIQANDHLVNQSHDRRVIEASLLGEAWFDTTSSTLNFKRGVSLYPLPLQTVHLVTKTETEALFTSAESVSGEEYDNRVDLGDYSGATRVTCRANMDKLFGQHCAILGSTGSGKSSAVAGIIHSVLDAEPREGVKAKPNIVLIDPHGEYGAAFEGKAQLLRAYQNINGEGEGDGAALLQLPYWLMSSDEFRSLVIGKTEFEATSQANVIYKALAHARMAEAGICRTALTDVNVHSGIMGDNSHVDLPVPCEGITQDAVTAFDRDKPRPFKLSEFEAHIRNRQAKRKSGANWADVTASEFEKTFSSILNKLNVLKLDPRISFMMAEHDEDHPTLTTCVAQFIRRPIDGSCGLKVIDISGIPNEIAGPLTGAICRLLFQYKVFQTREEREKDPVAIICEEAHRYVPDRGEAQYDVAQTAVRRIAREGRKYGLGLVLVSQRPSDVEGTVISQCNSWVVLRLTNSRDQEHVSRFLPDSLSGMTKQLSSLPRQEAIFVGEASALPARIRLRTLTPEQLPKSADISFVKAWSSEPISEEELDAITSRMNS